MADRSGLARRAFRRLDVGSDLMQNQLLIR